MTPVLSCRSSLTNQQLNTQLISLKDVVLDGSCVKTTWTTAQIVIDDSLQFFKTQLILVMRAMDLILSSSANTRR